MAKRRKPAETSEDEDAAAWLARVAAPCLAELSELAEGSGCRVRRRSTAPRGHLPFRQAELLELTTKDGHEGYIAMGWRGGEDFALAVKRPGKTNQFAWHQFSPGTEQEARDFARLALEHILMESRGYRGTRPEARE
ncbi:MAG TPA: hypothetical protein VM286_08860 [Candidatus Thermoplasmatota archaeon]|nr:hypothetical protein [Candidatus Thermoplasmatota archaeon]